MSEGDEAFAMPADVILSKTSVVAAAVPNFRTERRSTRVLAEHSSRLALKFESDALICFLQCAYPIPITSNAWLFGEPRIGHGGHPDNRYLPSVPYNQTTIE